MSSDRVDVSVILGTRPEAIKLAPVINQLRKVGCNVHVCSTGQHRQMLDPILSFFDIQPDIDLDIMSHGQGLGALTAKAVSRLDAYLQEQNPRFVMVQGDTTSAFCGALAGFYHRCGILHVEAGLRTHNLFSPWPEEANRQLIGRLATRHYAPTTASQKHLLAEGVSAEQIRVTGNTVIDALLAVVGDSRLEKVEVPGVSERQLTEGRIVLMTGHRRENIGSGFERICAAVSELASAHPETLFVYPVHLNPAVQKTVREILTPERNPNVLLTHPLDYLPFVKLMNASYMIVSDSGGVQEEAPSLGKPVLVTRDTTERQEGVEAGTTKLVGTDTRVIVDTATALLNDEQAYQAMASATNPYGTGDSSVQIAEDVLGLLKEA